MRLCFMELGEGQRQASRLREMLCGVIQASIVGRCGVRDEKAFLLWRDRGMRKGWP